jgi:hypothetical protein
MMRAALAVSAGFPVARCAAAPLVDLVGSAVSGSVRGVARAVSPGALLSAAERLLRGRLVCLPGFAVLRLAPFAARRVGPPVFAVAGAISAHVALVVPTYPGLDWPGPSVPAVLVPVGAVAGLVYWGIERLVLGGRRAMGRGRRPA